MISTVVGSGSNGKDRSIDVISSTAERREINTTFKTPNTSYVRFTDWFNPLSESVSHLRKSSEGFAAVSSCLVAGITTFAGAGERGDGLAPFVGGLVAKDGVEGEETTAAGRTC